MKADALSSGRRRRLPFGLLMVAAFVILSLLFQFYTLYRVTNYSSDCNNDKKQSFDDELREISGSRRLGILNNRTRFDLALESPNPPTIYTCGDNSKEYFEVIGGIFDEYKTNGKFLDETPWYDANGVRGLSQVESTDYDLFVTTYQVQCSSDATTWLTNKFKGQVSSVTQYQSSFESLSHSSHSTLIQFIYMSGESQNYPFEGGSIASGNPKYHVFGPIDAETEFDYPITYMQTTWLNTFQKMLGPDVMMTGNSRPNGKSIYIFKNDSFVSNPDGGRYFLVYGQNNCVKYRDEALRNFAELDIGDVHQAGKCGPPIWTKNVIKLGKPRISIYNWRNSECLDFACLFCTFCTDTLNPNCSDVKFFANFRFCLVLEHAHPHKYPGRPTENAFVDCCWFRLPGVSSTGYISEKILLAFAAGCVPIYYGPEKIFDIFNRDAFVFYNVSDPTPAIERVKELETNSKIYESVLKLPLLANGEKTLRKYFSFRPDIAGGWLRKMLHDKLNLP